MKEGRHEGSYIVQLYVYKTSIIGIIDTNRMQISDWGEGDWQMIANWYKVSLAGDENILKWDSGDCIYKTINILKKLNCTL